MPEFTPQQLLLMHIRKTYCAGVTADLARAIEKDGTYVARLFYPVGKKGGKGIGLEIMKACTAKFGLKAGFWESDPDHLNSQSEAPAPQAATPLKTNHAGLDSFYGWPFSDRVKPWQYNKLTIDQKNDVEKYILLQISAKDPPAEQLAPANNEDTGT